jgi:hypothetical protein
MKPKHKKPVRTAEEFITELQVEIVLRDYVGGRLVVRFEDKQSMGSVAHDSPERLETLKSWMAKGGQPIGFIVFRKHPENGRYQGTYYPLIEYRNDRGVIECLAAHFQKVTDLCQNQ